MIIRLLIVLHRPRRLQITAVATIVVVAAVMIVEAVLVQIVEVVVVEIKGNKKRKPIGLRFFV
jgi:hypothetical protein